MGASVRQARGPGPGRAAEVATLDGVGRGTTLAGRYRLDHRLSVGPGTEVWQALDTPLDRAVGVRFVTGPVAADVLDAARRASVVEDGRFVRVLDVGTETLSRSAEAPLEAGYVVSELVAGESLTERLQHGPVRASVMRGLVGEAAEALERARAAGLHHARLTPSCLVLTRDDAVKIAGLAVDAVLDPDPSAAVDGNAAARADAVGLVALLYAGLTARWPFGEAGGLPPAPQLGGQPVPPADLVPGVPNDLDTLCAVTLGPHDDGPRTPGELAEQLAPWGRRPGSHGGEEGMAGEDVTGPADRKPSGVRDAAGWMRPAGRFPVRLASTAGAVGAAAATAAAAAGIRPDPRTAPEELAGTGAGSGTLFERSAGNAPPAADPAPGTVSGEPTGAEPAGSTAAGADAGAAESPEAADTARTGSQSRVVLAVVAALVVAGLALAIGALSDLGPGDQAAAPPATAEQPEPTSTPEPSPEPPEEPAATPPADAARIQGVRTLDPQGDDGSENDDQAPLAIDDDPDTAWNSSTYSSPEFGNLKDGVGMVVDLGRPSTLSGVDLLVNGDGGEVEVRTAEGPSLEDSVVVATAALDGDPVEVTLEEPVQTQHVVLWFTRLPDTGDGYRVELAQVQVR